MEQEIKIYSMNEILDRIKNEDKKEKASNRQIGKKIGTNGVRINRFRHGEAFPTWDEARRIAQEAGLPVGITFLSVAHAKARSRADKEAWEQILDASKGRIMYSTVFNGGSTLRGCIGE